MRRAVLFVYVCLSLAVPAAAQAPLDAEIDGPPPPAPPAVVSRDDAGGVTVRTMRLPSPITIDGRLDERFYEIVPPVSDFIQQEPFEGEPATERTDVWVFYDDAHVYVSARLWETEPSRRVTSDMQRDAFNLFNNDHFGVAFDTFYDRRNGYFFYANAQGGMTDTALTNENPNNNWNAIWDVRTGEFDGGWTIEFRIPFRSMRFREGGRIWGLQFRRMVRWKNEISFLTPVPASYGRRGLTRVSSYGTMVDIESPGRLRNLDIKPFALGSNLTDLTAAPPFTNRRDADFGVDVKWGITQSLIADFTYNTDFAQVEDDEQQVNLSRFSLFFPEKREFFLEGQDIFAFGGAGGFGRGGGGGGGGFNNPTPVMFFSRRIGIEEGEVVPILAGSRLLGRGGGFQVGALHMRTDPSATGAVPATDFSVMRLNRDVLRRSRVGVLATRRAAASGPGDNYAYGADAAFNFGTSLSLNSYWARTDAPGRTGDETSYRAQFDWNADRTGLQIEHLLVGDAFDPGIGFLRRSAFRRSNAQARFSPRPAGWGAVRKLYYEASLDYITDVSGALESREQQGQFRMEFESGDQWTVEYTRSFEALKNEFEVAKDVTVPVGAYDFDRLRTTYQLGSQRRMSGWVTAGRGSFYAGTLTELSWRGRVEFSSRFFAEPSVSWNRIASPWGEADTNLLSSRVTYLLSPRMFVSALMQYQSRADSMSTNARFRWEYQPGSELFVVYSDGRNTLGAGFPHLDNRSLIVKLTKLFRY
jgi:hypothetical protein